MFLSVHMSKFCFEVFSARCPRQRPRERNVFPFGAATRSVHLTVFFSELGTVSSATTGNKSLLFRSVDNFLFYDSVDVSIATEKETCHSESDIATEQIKNL